MGDCLIFLLWFDICVNGKVGEIRSSTVPHGLQKVWPTLCCAIKHFWEPSTKLIFQPHSLITNWSAYRYHIRIPAVWMIWFFAWHSWTLWLMPSLGHNLLTPGGAEQHFQWDSCKVLTGLIRPWLQPCVPLSKLCATREILCLSAVELQPTKAMPNLWSKDMKGRNHWLTALSSQMVKLTSQEAKPAGQGHTKQALKPGLDLNMPRLFLCYTQLSI
jgi:hypothetical protein